MVHTKSSSHLSSDEILTAAENNTSLLDQFAGLIMLIGAPDTGKSSFCRRLYRQMRQAGRHIAYLDGDPGQSSFGPPATISMTIHDFDVGSIQPAPAGWRRFIGSVSPRGHFLPLLVGAQHLCEQAQKVGVETILYDTTGLISPASGGTSLKLAKLELLRPSTVFTLQREAELEEILVPLRRWGMTKVIELLPSSLSRRREVPERQAHRAAQFRSYFAHSRLMTIEWDNVAVIPSARFRENQLVSLENRDGFCLALGIVEGVSYPLRRLILRTPLSPSCEISMLRVGDLLLDPVSFRDQRLYSCRDNES